MQKGLFIEENRENKLIDGNFSSFDELLTPFAPTYPDTHSSYSGNRHTRAYGRQYSLDCSSNRILNTRVKRKL